MPDYYKQHRPGWCPGGGKWGVLAQWLSKAVVSSPGVIACGRLGGRWFDSSGRFAFYFFWKMLFFGGRRLVARDFGALGIGSDGDTFAGLGECPQHQKWRFWHV